MLPYEHDRDARNFANATLQVFVACGHDVAFVLENESSCEQLN